MDNDKSEIYGGPGGHAYDQRVEGPMTELSYGSYSDGSIVSWSMAHSLVTY